MPWQGTVNSLTHRDPKMPGSMQPRALCWSESLAVWRDSLLMPHMIRRVMGRQDLRGVLMA